MPPVPRPAATVILLREPYAVLMVRRNPQLAFMGGFWVFPGGKVEPEDGTPEQAARREAAEEVGIELDPDTELIAFARWVTPEALPKRYDTWFFLAADPGAAAVEHPTVDGSEIVEAAWITPQAALEDGRPLAFPTRKQLERLADFTSADALISASRGQRIEPVLPVMVSDDGAPAVVVPSSSDAPEPAPERAPELPEPA
jgi:8-oxo-dGTP pyrophosphatase MutT (NUDIX family)